MMKRLLFIVGILFIILGICFNPITLRCFIDIDAVIQRLLLLLSLSFLFCVLGIILVFFGNCVLRLLELLKTKDFWLNFILVVFSIGIAITIAEFAFRVLFKDTKAVSYSKMARKIITDHPQLLIKEECYKHYYPGLIYKEIYPDNPKGYFDEDNSLTYRINAQGYRGASRNKSVTQDTLRIICIGDSFVFGNGLKLEDTFPYRLENRLNKLKPLENVARYEVLNFGIQATNTPHQLNLIKRKVLPYKPDVVLLVYFLNDCGGGQSNFLAVDLRSDRQTKFIRYLNDKSYFFNFVYHRVMNFLQTKLLVFFYNYTNSYHSPYFARNLESIKEIKQISQENDFDFIVASYPVLYNLHNYPFSKVNRRLERFAQENNIEFIDLLGAFKDTDYQGPELWVHPIDQHPNEVVSRLVADYLYDKLLLKWKVDE